MTSLLSIHYDNWVEVNYIGGLGILLRFDCPESTNEFLLNEARWKEMFNQLSMGDLLNEIIKRTKWIKIVRLPLKFWCESNLEKIINRYGKIIAPFDDYKHMVDISYVKLGILTNRKTNINEEGPIGIGGKFVMVGIVETEQSFSFNDDKYSYLSNNETMNDT